MEIRSLVAYNRLGARWQKKHKEDFHLLIYAILGLVTQLLMASFWAVTFTVSMYNAEVRAVTKASLPYIVDLLSLTGSVCLLISSKTVRTMFASSYGCPVKKSDTNVTVYSANARIRPISIN
ncbi:hypothetical protein AAVH_09763 [Aphelenchoides avenae]|nr:hypothetical protein AAVH_09763 [Aphelenchus avenae]